jgi:hypothetical protein
MRKASVWGSYESDGFKAFTWIESDAGGLSSAMRGRSDLLEHFAMLQGLTLSWLKLSGLRSVLRM